VGAFEASGYPPIPLQLGLQDDASPSAPAQGAEKTLPLVGVWGGAECLEIAAQGMEVIHAAPLNYDAAGDRQGVKANVDQSPRRQDGERSEEHTSELQ